MNAMEPTYFLYAGRLFHEAALPALLAQLHRADASSDEPQPRAEDPGPEGPEGEPVGEEDEDEGTSDEDRTDEKSSESKPAPVPGPGMPVVPEHGSPDANPIDPRVF